MMNPPVNETPVGLSVLIEKVRLTNIRLIASACETRIAGPHEAGPVVMNLAATGALAERQADDSFGVDARASFDILPRSEGVGEAEAEPVVNVTASFRLEYEFPAELDPSDAVLNKFADTNGVFNAWPYLREFIQSMILRMGLPAVTIPLHRIAPAAETGFDGVESAEHATESTSPPH